MRRKTRSGQEKNEKKRKNTEKEMTLSGHLRELRNRILICVILLVAAMLIALRFAPELVTLLLNIGRTYQYEYVYIAPQELLMVYFSAALTVAVCITLPMILYQTWAFIRPGLRKNENFFFLLALVFGLGCFGLGIFFAYRVMLPFMLYFLISLSDGSGVSATISVQSYISFLMTIFIIFGAIFELPVVSILLTQMGLLKVKWMKAARKVVVVASFFVAALITPPDILSQVMVAIPILLLYELSIALSLLFQKLRKRKTEEEGS